MGPLIGDEHFIPEALDKADRRSGRESLERKRSDDFGFEPAGKVLYEFEEKHGIKLADLDTGKHSDKRLRAELLVHLKERAGLRYSEIAKMDLLQDLRISSLGSIYMRNCCKFFRKNRNA